MDSTTALLMAAGSGGRFGGARPKQFVSISGRPAIAWSLEKLSSHGAIGQIVVVVPQGYEDEVSCMLGENDLEKVRSVIAGGENRQESVWIGLQAVDESVDRVVVHDAVRPCFSAVLLDRVLETLKDNAAVVPVLPVVDTLIREDGGWVDALLDRAHISRVQTPQAFRTSLLIRAHERARERGFASSDDGSLVFFLGEPVRTIPGECTNIKITFQEDIEVAEAILAKYL